ncbi:MAG: hypothetical protein ABI290_05175, partial [Ginsengibacter sp.]
QIILPENSSVDMATCEIYSLALTAKVDAQGSVKAPYSQGFPNVVYLFDKNKNVILAGFITDSTNTISVASTAEVLLYFGMGTTFQPHEIMEKFINGIGKVPGVTEWKTELEVMFKNDPLMLQKGLFVESLKTKVDAIIKTGTIPRRPADITVDANDTRSGLQLSEKGLNSFIIQNGIRRRAHAFVYKMDYTDLDGDSKTVIPNIGSSTTSIVDFNISPTGAIRDYKGVMQDWAAGKGMEFAVTTNGPTAIPLEDNEKEANFKIRVVGPGKPVFASMTTYERERWWNVSLKTALFDFLMPIVLDAIGHKEILKNMNTKLNIGDNLKNLEALVEKTKDLIAAIPAATDALESGDYKKVTTEVFFAITNSRLGNVADDWLKFLYNNVAEYVQKNGSEYYKDALVFDDRLENLLKVLEVLDLGLKGVDYARLTGAILQSKTLEEWDLKAQELKLTLDPKEFTIGPLDQKLLTANMKTSLGDDMPVIEYQWETTGKYGYLWDDRGHKGNAFSSSIKEAYYLCNAMESDIVAGKEYADTIKVTAYLKIGQTSSKIGTNVSIARISRDVFKLGWTPTVNITKKTDQYGNVSYESGPPFFTTEFEERKSARSYRIAIIKKDGTKAAPTNYLPSQLTIENGIVKYKLSIGTLYFQSGMDENSMLAEKARQEKMMNDYVGNGIEVTVVY